MASLGKKKTVHERDIPDYKAPVLRPAFLTLLFLFVCGLFATLEYLVRTLPNEHDRNKIPHDVTIAPGPESHERRRNIVALEYHIGRPRAETSAFIATTPQGPLSPTSWNTGRSDSNAITVAPSAGAPTAQITIITTSPTTTWRNRNPAIKIPVPDPDPKLDPTHYRTLPVDGFKPLEAYVTWANSWYGHTADPYARTALFPGQSTGDKCIYKYQGVVVTGNNTGCRAIWDPNSQWSPLKGWRRATWISESLWLEIGGECDQNYDDWYSGYPSNDPVGLDLRFAYNPDEIDPVGWGGSYGHFYDRVMTEFISNLLSCSRQNGSTEDELEMIRTAGYGTWQAKNSQAVQDEGPPASILLVYRGLLQRQTEGGTVDWLTTLGHETFLLNQFIATIQPDGWLSINTTGVWLPAQPTISADVSTPTASTTTGETINHPLPKITSPAPRSTRTPLPHTLAEVQAIQRYETATTFSANGHLTTSRFMTEKVTAVLVNVPAAMVPASISVQTNSEGQPTNTLTDFNGDVILVTRLTIFTNTLGSPTATKLTTVPATSVLKTLTNSAGAPFTTITSFPVYPHIPGSKPANIVLAKTASYFVVYFFPIALTLLVLIPIQTIDTEIKLLLPSRLLTLQSGSPDALCLRTGGLAGRLNGWRLLWHHRDPISVISDLLVVCAAALVAISGETVGLKLRGTCVKQNMRTCLVTVAAFPRPARAAEALLGGLMVLILGLGVVLGRRRTGIAVHPGSVAAVCGILQIKGVSGLVRGVEGECEWDKEGKRKGKGGLDARLAERLKGTKMKLGWDVTGGRANDYGLIVVGRPTKAVPEEKLLHRTDSGGRRITFQIGIGERAFQWMFLLVLCGLLTLVLYYEGTVYRDPSLSPFEYFMDSQEFGVIMLFTSVGEFICFVWDHLFSSTYALSSRKNQGGADEQTTDFTKKIVLLQMAQKPQPAKLSVLKSRPTNVFVGLWGSLRERDLLGITMTFAGILSKLLPALLSGIPFQSAQTYLTHEICAWSVIAVLIVMIFVLIYHMWRIKWPIIPAGPDLLAGWMYYVCDSYMLRDFERLSLLGHRERDLRVVRMERLYRYGWMTGVSGEKRMGIDYAEGEQGYRLKSLGALGFGIGGKARKT